MIAIPVYRNNQYGTPATREFIPKFLNETGMKAIDIIRLIKEKYPNGKMSAQNFSNKLSRGSFNVWELAQIAGACGYELAFVKKEKSQERKMKTYNIRYTEILVGNYDIEAETPEEALKKFEEEMEDGNIDFGSLEVDTTDFKVVGERSDMIIDL